jgi:hypothetical protein
LISEIQEEYVRLKGDAELMQQATYKASNQTSEALAIKDECEDALN